VTATEPDNPRLAALDQATDEWREQWQAKGDKPSWDPAWCCECGGEAAGDWYRLDEEEDEFVDASPDDPGASRCDCGCHSDVWRALAAVTEAGWDERRQVYKTRLEKLRQAMSEAGATTLGELFEAQRRAAHEVVIVATRKENP
jgi:hypothetical protein